MGVTLAPQLDAAWGLSAPGLGRAVGAVVSCRRSFPARCSGGVFFLSFLPSLAQLLIVYPLQPLAGVWGLGFGVWTPVYVFGHQHGLGLGHGHLGHGRFRGQPSLSTAALAADRTGSIRGVGSVAKRPAGPCRRQVVLMPFPWQK